MTSRLVRIFVVGACFPFVACSASAEPEAVGANVHASQQVSIDEIVHELWNELLQKYVNGMGRVDYTTWLNSPADTSRLDQYLAELSRADPAQPSTRAAQLAFWINAYNAVTIKGILREYPTSSIRNHTSKIGGYNIWDDLKLNVGGRLFSLNQIEHDVLRKLGEPRIHFAIVCASHGCPRLISHAYTADRLQEQLRSNTTAFFAKPENFRYDSVARRFYISRILDWFGDDFGPSKADRLRALAPYLPTQVARDAAIANSVTLSYLKYDWSLNDQARRTAEDE